MQVPKLTKIVVNMAVHADAERDTIKNVAEDLTRITGQRAQIRKSRKSISNFKLREGLPIGARVTMRGERMYDFMERLIAAALPGFATSAACRSRGLMGAEIIRWA